MGDGAHLEEVTWSINLGSSHKHLGSLALGIVNMSLNFVDRSLMNQRAVSNTLRSSLSNFEGPNSDSKLLSELIVDCILYKDSIGTDTVDRERRGSVVHFASNRSDTYHVWPESLRKGIERSDTL